MSLVGPGHPPRAESDPIFAGSQKLRYMPPRTPSMVPRTISSPSGV